LSFYVALQSTGILEISFDPDQDVNGSLSISRYNTDAGVRPGWLTSYQDKFYSISRTDYPIEGIESGGVFAYQEPTLSAPPFTNLTLLDKTSSHGEGGVYVDVSPDGRTLAAANIDGSTVSIYPLAQDGVIGEATYVFHYSLVTPGPGNNDSQEIANPHGCTFDPTGKFMIVPDRGSDRLYIYHVNGPEAVVQKHNISLPLGTGPRHVTFSPRDSTTNYMYLISELDNTVRVFTLEYFESSSSPATDSAVAEGLTVTLTQTISTLGHNFPPSDPNNEELAAEIAVTNDRKFAYASNRNTLSLDSDTIAIYSVDPDPANDGHHLTYLGFNQTFGKIPRHFALSNDEDNMWVAVANQVTQDITVFERDVKSGFFKDMKGRLSLGDLDLELERGPMCIRWN
jgi:6-phosphogluconolactonase